MFFKQYTLHQQALPYYLAFTTNLSCRIKIFLEFWELPLIFTKPQCSSQCLQNPGIWSCIGEVKSRPQPYTTYFRIIRFNIILAKIEAFIYLLHHFLLPENIFHKQGLTVYQGKKLCLHSQVLKYVTWERKSICDRENYRSWDWQTYTFSASLYTKTSSSKYRFPSLTEL
jgi:hypothetical protein